MQQTSLKKPPDFIYSYGHAWASRGAEHWQEVCYHIPGWSDEPVSNWMIPGTYYDYAQ
jgi:hypothetical protein